MKLIIFYYNDGIQKMDIDHTEWIKKAPNTILKILFKNHNGAITEISGYAAYFVIDDFIGGFNPINGISLKENKSKYFPVDDFIIDKRVKLGKELSNKEWSDFVWQQHI